MISIAPIIAALSGRNRQKDRAINEIICYMAKKHEEENREREKENKPQTDNTEYPLISAEIKEAILELNGIRWHIPYIQRISDKEIISKISAALSSV